jgi:hypothetical protein
MVFALALIGCAVCWCSSNSWLEALLGVTTARLLWVKVTAAGLLGVEVTAAALLLPCCEVGQCSSCCSWRDLCWDLLGCVHLVHCLSPVTHCLRCHSS